MKVSELIELLEKVNQKNALVFVEDSEDANNIVDRVVVEHDMKDDMVVVILKT